MGVTREELKIRQNLSLEDKIRLSQLRIDEYYNYFEGNVYVGFSGGQDSTVALDITRKMYPNVPAVFCNTGLEFPEIVNFVKQTENVIWLKPKLSFKQVLERYGYPVVSKDNARKVRQFSRTKSWYLARRIYYGNYPGDNAKLPDKWRKLLHAPFKISDQCCDVMKKRPSKKYQKESGNFPILGTRVCESSLREKYYRLYGCNYVEGTSPRSTPLAFWTDENIKDYIKKYAVPYSKIYDKGYKRTGCIFCAFGLELEYKKTGTNRYKLLKKTHPKLYSYCMDNLHMREVLRYVGWEYLL